MLTVKLNRKPFEGRLDNFVDSFFSGMPALFGNDFNLPVTKGNIPVNVKETEKAYELEVVAPGFEKKDFTIQIEQNLLVISGEKKDEVKEETEESGKGEKKIRQEYSYRSFKRTFTLDDKIDATKIEASYINGVLLLNLPKREEVKTAVKAIAIK